MANSSRMALTLLPGGTNCNTFTPEPKQSKDDTLAAIRGGDPDEAKILNFRYLPESRCLGRSRRCMAMRHGFMAMRDTSESISGRNTRIARWNGVSRPDPANEGDGRWEGGGTQGVTSQGASKGQGCTSLPMGERHLRIQITEASIWH